MGAMAVADSASLSDAIMASASFDALRVVLQKTDNWQYTPDNRAGIDRAKTYVQGSDKDYLAGFFVSSINEWKVSQPRVIILTQTAYYRVTYNPKNGKIDHYHKTSLEKLRVLEKTLTGLKVYTTEQDGRTSATKMAGWLATKVGAKEAKSDEFDHSREYNPMLAGNEPPTDVVVDVIAAALARAAGLMHAAGGTPKKIDVITTEGRKKILADRKEADRLEKERIEREASEAELAKAMTEAREKTKPELLSAPMRRAKRAVEVNPALLEKAEQLKTTLEEEIKENERLARLERERVEREAATEELQTAIEGAKESRDATALSKPLKRAKRAVDLDPELIKQGDALKVELEEEKKEKERVELEEKRERERLEKLERERVEREAASEELEAAITAARESRDPNQLVKPLKRAKRAVDVDTGLLGRGDALKNELDEEKKEKERQAREAERERKEEERKEREAAKAAKAEEEAAAKAKAEEEAAAAAKDS
eukprot:Transcript_18618.p2 GENE.Transcript_18618~~Transcript_18618.p2  ORF type:complete len:525 (+),score=260.72 Transcript_18618:119-1576(+)